MDKVKVIILFQRISLIVIFLISIGVGLAIHKTRKRNPTILNHISKIIFDAIAIISGALIGGLFLRVKEQQMGMIMILITVIIFFQIVIEIVNEPIKTNKIILSLLLILPVVGIYYGNSQFKVIYNSEQTILKKSEDSGDYINTTYKRKFNLRSQRGNKLSNKQQKILKYDDFLLINGKSTPNIYVYGEDASTHKKLFLTKTNNVGNFTVKLDKKKIANNYKINVFVNNIALQNKQKVVKGASAIPDRVLSLNNLSEQGILTEGVHQVGDDLDAGNYVLLSEDTGSIQWLNGDNIERAFDKNLYIKFHQNDMIKVNNAKLLKITSGMNFANGDATNGMLKVGTDILPGKYQLKSTDNYSIAKLYSKPFENNSQEGELVITEHVTLQPGDYIYVMNTKLIKK